MGHRMDDKRSRESGVGSHTTNHRAGVRGSIKTLAGGAQGQMATTIVEYTDKKPPTNLYPERIVSPVRSGPCCFTDMEEVGEPREEGRWVYQYKRCRKCGFSLRVILREIPDASLAAELRKILANSFVRNVPE
jgi:hypothetical protein